MEDEGWRTEDGIWRMQNGEQWKQEAEREDSLGFLCSHTALLCTTPLAATRVLGHSIWSKRSTMGQKIIVLRYFI